MERSSLIQNVAYLCMQLMEKTSNSEKEKMAPMMIMKRGNLMVMIRLTATIAIEVN